MDKKLIFNEHGERGTQSMIGGNTTKLALNGTVAELIRKLERTNRLKA